MKEIGNIRNPNTQVHDVMLALMALIDLVQDWNFVLQKLKYPDHFIADLHKIDYLHITKAHLKSLRHYT